MRLNTYVNTLPDDYVQCRNVPSLYINHMGIVYEKISTNKYKLAHPTIEKKHNHDVLLIQYKNENGNYRRRSLAKLLAEAFLIKDGKCPHLVFKDGNYLNIKLDNITFAGKKNESLICKSCGKTNNENERECIFCGNSLKKSRNLPNIVDQIPLEAKETKNKNIFITKEGILFVRKNNNKIYKYDDFLTKKKKSIVISSEQKKTITIRLEVAKAFVPNDNPKVLTKLVSLDGNYMNIDLKNLKWVTNDEAKKYRPKHICPQCNHSLIDYSAKLCLSCWEEKKHKNLLLKMENKKSKLIDEAQFLLNKIKPTNNTKIILEEIIQGLTPSEICQKHKWSRQYVNIVINNCRKIASDSYIEQKREMILKKIYNKKYQNLIDYDLFKKIHPFIMEKCNNSEKIIVRKMLPYLKLIGIEVDWIEDLILYTDKQITINRKIRENR